MNAVSGSEAEATAKAVHQAPDVTEDGIALASQVAESMTALKHKVSSVAEQILQLSEQAQQIGGIAKAVGELASETNMLALNAAVEAAEQRVVEKTSRMEKSIRELRLLQHASRLLSERPFDRAAMEEITRLIHTAWAASDPSEVRIAFRDVTVQTPGWRPTEIMRSASFTTSGGTGTIDVAFASTHMTNAESLAEDEHVLHSLAEILATHAERDVAERRRAGLEGDLRQSQKMEALGKFAGGIAHDFNNLLTAIGGNVELALRAAPAEPVRSSLEEILRAHGRARDLVQRILMFSRLQESARQPVSLGAIAEEVLTMMRASLPRNVEVEFSCAPAMSMIAADSSQIHQVIVNLVTNAVHAMAERGGKLSVSVDRVIFDETPAFSVGIVPGAYLMLKVTDTGVGISPEIVNQIFDPFFTTKGLAGTGLGLAVVHGIVRDHQGAITVDSRPGEGTTLRLFFPEAVGAADAVGPAPATPERGTGQHIMYVDDEESLVLVMTRIIEALGYRCTGFVDPHAALQAFRADPRGFGAVITDMTMPGMSGLELARALSVIRPGVPIAISSGYLASETGVDESEEKKAGVTARLGKPARMGELLTMLSGMLTKNV